MADAETISPPARVWTRSSSGRRPQCASQGARVDTNFVPRDPYPGDFWHYARMTVLTAARIAGILARRPLIPTSPPTPRLRAAGAVRGPRSVTTANRAIHPSQIDLANAAFTDAQEVWARRNLRPTGRQGRGLGATSVDGQRSTPPTSNSRKPFWHRLIGTSYLHCR